MDATNWNHTLQFTSPVVYRDHTIFMLLHCRKEDIPNWSFEGAPQYLTELYKFLVLVRQIFISKGCESDMFMLQLESFIPSPDKEQRAKLSPGVIFIFTFKYDDVEEHFEVSRHDCEQLLYEPFTIAQMLQLILTLILLLFYRQPAKQPWLSETGGSLKKR